MKLKGDLNKEKGSLSEGESKLSRHDGKDIMSKPVMKKKKLNPSREVKTVTNTSRPMTRSRTTLQVKVF